jgi:hypothetical protein
MGSHIMNKAQSLVRLFVCCGGRSKTEVENDWIYAEISLILGILIQFLLVEWRIMQMMLVVRLI